MQTTKALLMSLLATIVCATVSGATVRRLEGEAQFEFAARFEQPPQIGQPVRIRLMVLDFTGFPNDSITFSAQLALPDGWEVVDGSTTLNLRTRDRELGWSVTVRPSRAGRFELRRTLRIDRGAAGIDEGEYVMAVDLRSDSSTVGPARAVRLETVRGGRRYRYGDSFLVPIDGAERITQADLSERARVVSHPEAKCLACTAADPHSVSWIVFVDRTGRVKDARLASEIDPKSLAATVTRAALGEWTFAPAKAGGQGAADWLVVHVAISK